MSTLTQRQRLRDDIGADIDALTEEEADRIIDEAQESYTDAASYEAYARVIAIRRMRASAAKLTTYRQNNSSENLSDVFKHLGELQDFWQKELDDAVIANSDGAMRFGRTGKKPARIKEYPSVSGSTLPRW